VRSAMDSRYFAAVSIIAAMAAAMAVNAGAATDPSAQPQIVSGVAGAGDRTNESDKLETIVVTGSIIPQSTTVTTTPITVISAEDMEARGFVTVADALQQSSFATGSVEGSQFSGSFTQGAQTLSMFGLSVSYVKYLIDGRPMSDYPALYNGTDMFTNLNGIPAEFVDHIDILPGGQSSLYGSDAIAGVVNIVLKKKLDSPYVDVRYGAYQNGGGVDRRIALGDSFRMGAADLLVGVQYAKADPIWGYQRPLTSSYYTAGSTPVTAERDYVIYGLSVSGAEQYYFLDPADCASVASEFGNSARKYTRPGIGDYCGTTRAGFYTLNNGTESTQGYLRLTYEVSDHLQLYSDLILNHDIAEFNNGSGLYSTGVDYGNYYDPNLANLVTLQHFFSPEEAGGLNATTDSDDINAYRATIGGQGRLSASNWSYDADITRVQQKLTENHFAQWAAPLENFYSGILGPNLGPDPIYGVYPTFTPNYASFYAPITPAQYASFSGYAVNHSETSADLLRIQFTNTSLFRLPGGKAAAAMVAEGGDESWSYSPDARLIAGEAFGTTAVAGSGNRSRYAVTSELRLPLLTIVTLDASARYDDYRVEGQNVDKSTYNLSLEVHALETLLLRGRYGTAFKAPTLSDEFQGPSGGYASLTDYYQCSLHGFTGANLGNCPYGDNFPVTTSGNRALKPITATVWDVGSVWKPTQELSMSVDYINWNIKNEVTEQSADQLLITESLCRLGTYDINSPTCVAALSQVTRNANDQLVAVYTPKINVSQETLSVFTAGLQSHVEIGRAGKLVFQASYSDLLTHTYRQYAGDAVIDLLRNPQWSTDFKSKVNGSVTWSLGAWSSTAYVNRYGGSANFLAQTYGYGTPGAFSLSPWTLCNVSVRYQWNTSLQLSFAVDNAMNASPPPDHSYPGIYNQPYNTLNYNDYGRSYLLQAHYTFGR
jgi:iron complex outermembrane receptor protein